MIEAERNRQALEEIVRQCGLIEERLDLIAFSKEAFMENSLLQDGCAFCLLQIGEAANRLSDDFREKTREIGWRRVVGMRNIIAHAYGSFDLLVAWETITEDIPVLKGKCEAILGEGALGSS